MIEVHFINQTVDEFSYPCVIAFGSFEYQPSHFEKKSLSPSCNSAHQVGQLREVSPTRRAFEIRVFDNGEFGCGTAIRPLGVYDPSRASGRLTGISGQC